MSMKMRQGKLSSQEVFDLTKQQVKDYFPVKKRLS